MMLIYTLVHLDKNALSYGAVFELQAETGLVGAQYAWLTSIVYLTQLVWQPLSAFALVRFPMGKWVTLNVLCWGICVMCMAACKNWTGLMVTRSLMGGFEATVAPAFIAVTQTWWRRREQTYRNSFWLVTTSIAGFVSPRLVGALRIAWSPDRLRRRTYQYRNQAIPRDLPLSRRHYGVLCTCAHLGVSRPHQYGEIPFHPRESDCDRKTAGK